MRFETKLCLLKMSIDFALRITAGSQAKKTRTHVLSIKKTEADIVLQQQNVFIVL